MIDVEGSMFTGTIRDQTVISDQPVLVVDGEAIVSSFSKIEEATEFIHKSHSDTARIFRHNGSNWDIWTEFPQKRGKMNRYLA